MDDHFFVVQCFLGKRRPHRNRQRRHIVGRFRWEGRMEGNLLLEDRISIKRQKQTHSGQRHRHLMVVMQKAGSGKDLALWQGYVSLFQFRVALVSPSTKESVTVWCYESVASSTRASMREVFVACGQKLFLYYLRLEITIELSSILQTGCRTTHKSRGQ